MCGIFGVISYDDKLLTIQQVDHIKQLVINLLEESEIRGRDASGILIVNENKAYMYKNKVSGSILPRLPRFKHMLNTINHMNKFRSVIGHTRSQTKGSYTFNINNHPIIAGHVIGVHNGIIGNDDDLFSKYKEKFKRKGQVDSEIIFQLINYYLDLGFSVSGATRKATAELKGSYTCAFVDTYESNKTVIFSGNTYSSANAFYLQNNTYSEAAIRNYKDIKLIIFASSDIILHNAIIDNSYIEQNDDYETIELQSQSGVVVNATTGAILRFGMSDSHDHTLTGNYYAL